MTMKVFVLGLDGATRDLLQPLMDSGVCPNLARLRTQGAYGALNSVFPPLSPVAWSSIITGKNPGKHGVFEFLKHDHQPLAGKVNTSRSIHAEMLWETLERFGKTSVAAAVPMSSPLRRNPFPGVFLGDFLSSPNDPGFASDKALLAELETHLGGPYRPWSTAIHDGGREAEALEELTDFLDHHLRAVQFLAKRCSWDLFMYDLMAVDRIQHELWHVWDSAHRVARGREAVLEKLRPKFLDFWRRLDEGVGDILKELPEDATVLLISDHGFGPIEWYVNFNVWLLDQGFMSLKNTWYVKQKHWFYRRGVTPAWFYRLMVKLGGGRQRVGRFQGNQHNWLDRLGESVFLSRHHLDWSRTKAYAQGNFGQISINVKGRQPNGCVEPEDVPRIKQDIKDRLAALRHPETNEPLVAEVKDSADLYRGSRSRYAPDLTVVLSDWRYRTIGLHDFTTHQVISPAFGPTGDHRMEGVFFAVGPGIAPESRLQPDANLLDIAPTVMTLFGLPVPEDYDGRVLSEALIPALADASSDRNGANSNGTAFPKPRIDTDPTDHDVDANDHSDADIDAVEEDDAAVRQRLHDLGYL